MKHLKIGGSTAGRTIACPAWLKRSEGIPRPKSGVAADHGNLCHDAMEYRYRHDKPFSEMVGKLAYEDQVLSADDVEELLVPAQYMTEEILDRYDIDQMLLEPFVQYKDNEIGGSIDMLGLSYDRKTILVLDYKFGGRYVSPKSAQLPFYGLCASRDPNTKKLFTEAETIVFCIVQPRCSDKPQYVEEPISTLVEFEQRLLNALANQDKATTGSHCDFCPAAPVCKTRLSQARSALMMTVETAAEIAEALTLANELESWIKQVKDQAYGIATDGGVLPGYKLVEGRSVRKWKKGAEDVLLDKLGDKAYEQKLIGITKAEKLLGKGALEEMQITEKPEGKPTLVPEESVGVEVSKNVPDSLKNLVDKSLNK